MTLSDEEYFEARRDLRDKLLRLARWKVRETRRRWTSQRARRLPKEARALRSLVAELQAKAIMPAQRPKRERRDRGQRATSRGKARARPSDHCGYRGTSGLPAHASGRIYK